MNLLQRLKPPLAFHIAHLRHILRLVFLSKDASAADVEQIFGLRSRCVFFLHEGRKRWPEREESFQGLSSLRILQASAFKFHVPAKEARGSETPRRRTVRARLRDGCPNPPWK